MPRGEAFGLIIQPASTINLTVNTRRGERLPSAAGGGEGGGGEQAMIRSHVLQPG